MLPEINFDDSDFEFVEQILLDEGQSFDQERRAYITNFSSLDLQAVPGSGKTTALLAKLLLLERKRPKIGEKGVLVISHTNKAVEEIRSKIQSLCPKLFSQPNFVGTIQSFVDQFLAIPIIKSKRVRISDTAYYERYGFELKRCIQGHERDTFKAVRYLDLKNQLGDYRLGVHNSEVVVLKSKDGDPLIIRKPGDRTSPNYSDYPEAKKEKIRKYLIALKKKIMRSGILHYDDAYFLADIYIKKHPMIAGILRKRFSYVFVDEMQDMDESQNRLLENVFGPLRQEGGCFQRLGDKNQAIYYSNRIQAENFWVDASQTMRLSGSHRLNPINAQIVQRLALDGAEVQGLREIETPLLPRIIVYDEERKTLVIDHFCEIVSQLQDEYPFLANGGEKVRAIGWRRYTDANHKNCIDSFSHVFNPKEESKTEFERLVDYFQVMVHEEISQRDLFSTLENCVVRILRLEGVQDSCERFFTSTRYSKYAETVAPEKFTEIGITFFKISRLVRQKKIQDALIGFRSIVPRLLQEIFGYEPSASLPFTNEGNIEFPIPSTGEVNPGNEDIGIVPIVTTIHSVKGQTHSATLLLESFFEKKNDLLRVFEALTGEKTVPEIIANFEAEIAKLVGEIGTIEAQHKERGIKSRKDKIETIKRDIERVKKCAKMAYVATSRPKNLLCIAINETEFSNHLESNLSDEEWIVDRTLIS